jgi:RHS repeat-associated protein
MQLKINKIAILIIAATLFILPSFSQITQPGGVVTYVVKKEGVTDASLISGLTNAEKVQAISYVDGFGRGLQSFVVAGSPNGKDIVSFNRYDEFGRQLKQYLPYESSTTGGSYTDPATILTNQANFYSQSVATANKVAWDNSPYSEVSVDASPLQRVLKVGGVGDGFQLNQHYKTMNYRNNSSVIDGYIRLWVFSGGSANGNATYSDNDLSVSEVVDENGAKSSVYKDRFGRLILKRQDAPVTGSYDTYYVYDNIGNIVFIVPPKAIAKMFPSSSYNTTQTPELIYQFWYDSKNRVVQKKVPGAKETYVVYDPLDRVVLTQDGNMRAGGGTKWAYVKYDNANRVVVQGIYTHSSVQNQSQMQAYVNSLACYQPGSSTYYELKQAGTFSGYSNQCFPTTGTEERNYSYYDNYDFDANGIADYSKSSQGLTNEADATDLTYGLVTGTKRKILGSSPAIWITDVSFYDKYYHVIQVRSSNQLDNALNDHTTNVVTFTGKVTEAKQYKSFAGSTITVRTRYEYDDMERLTKVKQTNPTGSEITVAKYEYNPLGQLVDKKLHSTNGINYLQSVDMRYNIRGQLTSINNSSRTNDGGVTNDETNDVFGMEILYDKLDATGLVNTQNYNGMISAVKWSTQTPVNPTPDVRSFKYTYDKLYRLTASTYQAKAYGGSTWTKDQDGFNEILGYDENGNIKTLLRKAVLGGAVTTIDNLTYSYRTGDTENQLDNLSDGIGTNATGYGFRNYTGSSNAYTYDDNGNLTTDPKKGTVITYNEQNKPTQILQTSTLKTITYRYDAAGIRISKYVYNGSSTQTTEYVGGYTVENNNLSYYGMAEGRVVASPGPGSSTIYTMEYFITDQQGNTRVSFKDDGNGTNTAVVTQENSYYAFGMQMAGSYMPTNANKKLYNAGSMWQDDIEGLADYYSTFYREYDPVIGRFNCVDPLAESTDNITTYAYANNNPVMMNDPMGNSATPGSVDELQVQMQEEYNAWHATLYGNRFEGLWGYLGGTGSSDGSTQSTMSEYEFYSTYQGMKIRMMDFGTGKGHGFDKWGNFGHWVGIERVYDGNLAPANGNTFEEVHVINKSWVWVQDSGNKYSRYRGMGNGFSIMQTGQGSEAEENNWGIGYTHTEKYTTKTKPLNDPWIMGVLTIKKFSGTVSGKEGKYLTINHNESQEGPDGTDFVIGGRIAISTDGTIGVNLWDGYEIHTNILTSASALEGYNFGWSHTDKGAVSGMDISYKPGKALPLVAGAIVVALNPELWPTIPAALKAAF